MIPSPPSIYPNRFERLKSRFVVLVGGPDGQAPSLADETDTLVPMRISTTAGGNRVDSFSLEMDMYKADQRLVDTLAPVDFNHQIEIRRLDENGEPTIVVAWGFVSSYQEKIDQKTELVTMEARIDDHVFGRPLKTVPYVNPEVINESIDAERPWIFNPEIDDKIEPNRSDDDVSDTDHGLHFFFVDPESVRTEPARSVQDIQPAAEFWTLPEAVLTLCWHLNPDEEWITNPTIIELNDVFVDFDNDDLIRNHRLPMGEFLPKCLDDLLHPYGFSWFLVHELDDEDNRKTTIRVYRRGVGDLVSLRMQRPGETIHQALTNVASLNLDFSIVELANKITIYGHTIQREITANLVKAWPPEQDDLDLYELERGKPEADQYPHAFRKFVLNEAGDYNDTRPEITEQLDLSEVFNPDDDKPLLIRRRRLLPCVSTRPTGDDENSYRIFVQWWDENADGAVTHTELDDPGWTRVKWPFSVLEKECGILFEGPTPPDVLYALCQEDELHLRVTATIEGDHRISHTVNRRNESPNGRDLELVLDLPNKFFDRNIQESGDLQSVLFLHPDVGTPDIKDDTTRIEQYAEELQKAEDCAEVSVSVVLDGADYPEYEIGKLIEKVDGRNLILDANSIEGEEPRRLQIVGWNMLLDGQQRIELLLETFTMERADFDELFDLRK